MVDTTVSTTTTSQQSQSLNLLKVLGPAHIWALGVGIVLVGEFMGWNYAAGKGGAFGALIACFVSGILYTCVAKIDSEVTSTVASAGGQYAQAKHTIGPLMAFNVGLFMTLTYLMLNAGDVLVAGQLVQIGAQQLGHDIPWQPFTVLFLALLTLLNYRGVLATLTVNFVITAAAFLSIIILFIGVKPWAPGEVLLHKELLTPLPYGWIGVIAALHFGMWFYLGIEGTCQAAEEVRSPGRALPLGTMSGIITLLIAAAITWYVACGLMPWEYIGWDATLAPLYDSARMTGSPFLIVLLFIGTLLSAIASSNGCTNDQARAWFAMGRDRYLPEWFAARASEIPDAVPLHPVPDADRAGLRALHSARSDHHLLDPVGTAELHVHADQYVELPEEMAGRARSAAASAIRSTRSRR